MNCEVTDLKAVIAAAIKAPGMSMDNMVEAMGEGYAKLMAYIAEQGKEIAGPPYCCYMNASEDFSSFDMEFGIPVSQAVAEKDDIFMSCTYEGKAAVATHKGAYKDIETTYTALMNFVNDNSLELTGVYYDYYISNPEDTPEDELLSQVVFAIK